MASFQLSRWVRNPLRCLRTSRLFGPLGGQRVQSRGYKEKSLKVRFRPQLDSHVRASPDMRRETQCTHSHFDYTCPFSFPTHYCTSIHALTGHKHPLIQVFMLFEKITANIQPKCLAYALIACVFRGPQGKRKAREIAKHLVKGDRYALSRAITLGTWWFQMDDIREGSGLIVVLVCVFGKGKRGCL
eukprot:411715-Amorphochlora_amoeboformis.AAC.1